MPEPTADTLREKFSIAAQIADARLTFCVDDAIRKVKRKVGIEAYDEVFNAAASTVEDSEYLDTNTTTTDEEALRLGDVTDAVLYYAMAKLVINANLRTRPSGQVKKEQDAGSPAMASSSQVINEYLTPQEVKVWVDQLNTEADKLIAPYVIAQEPVNPYGWGRSVRG